MHPQTPTGPTSLPGRTATPQHRTPYARRDPTDKPGKETKPHAPQVTEGARSPGRREEGRPLIENRPWLPATWRRPAL